MKKIVLLLSFCLSFILGYSQYDLSKNIDRQVMVVPQKGMESQTQAFIQRSNAQIVANFEQLGWYVVLLPENLTQDSFVRSSKDLPFIKEVYKDQKVEMKLDYIPNDVEFSQCWHLRQSTDKDIDADEAWDLVPANNPFVSVAMFDGGLDLTIPDLVGNTTNPFNAVNSTTNIPYVNAEDKHGTTCSGTIAAVTNNGIGVSSVGNNKVKVMPVNIMSEVFAGGSFRTSDVIQINGVNAAMANPTCVAIAMSYGGSSYSAALDASFQAARTTARGGKGMVVMASSGNGFSGTANQYPANYPAVWGIGATSQSDVRASFSNFGQICDISAPGVGIRTTDRLGAAGYNAGDYTSINGTSFSCPITAAAAAFVFYKNWELTDDQVLQILAQSAEKVGGYVYSNNPTWPLSTRSNELGYGRINLKDAIIATPNPGGVTPPPPPPTLIHNFVINTLTVSPAAVTVGSNITITANVATQNPTYPSVNVMTQHRLSTNTTWGDSDDIVIGTTSGNLGGGVATDVETITYNVGNITGLRYVISRVNYMGTISETNTNDNTRQTSFNVTQPVVSGGDLSVTLTSPLTPSITIPSTQAAASFQWKVTNTGSVPITSFTWIRTWVDCSGFTSSFSPCGATLTWPTTTSWQGPLLPGQYILLPGGGTLTNRIALSWNSSAVCFSSTTCAIQPGGSNTMRVTILTVNGGTGDSNLANNQVDCVVTRLATAVNNGDVTTPEVKFVEVRQFSNLYEKPIRYGSIDEAILEKGLNIIHIHYSDGTVEIRKISVN
jgi:hypothetical protein